MRLRRLGPDRAAQWRDIRLEALRRAPEAFGTGLDEWEGRPLSDFADWLTRSRIWSLGPLAHPLGVAGWYRDKDDPALGWLIAVYLRPEARGKGQAGRLIARVMRDAAMAGCARMALNVGAGNRAAQTLYRRAGFYPAGDAEPTRAGVEQIEMRRDLPAPYGWQRALWRRCHP